MGKLTAAAICLGTLIALNCPNVLSAQNMINLATAEREPYIGENLPQKGYVYELVTEAFHRAGYNTTLSFYPVARATYLAQHGWRDGVVPMYYEDSLQNTFLFSDPFPGGTLGLFKRKTLQVPEVDFQNQNEVLWRLRGYTFGVVRGAVNTPEFDAADFLKKDFATSDMQNLLKLSKGRIDFAVIDKYTAADIMVHKLPHMIGKFEFMNPPLALKPFYIAFSKKDPDSQQYVKDFNQGLNSLIQDDTLEKMLYKHGLLQTHAPAQDKTVIRIGLVESPDMLLLKELSREFERQHPEIELEWIVLEENTLRLRLLSDLAIADGRFDIMMIGSQETPIWAQRGWLLPIEHFPENYEPDDLIAPVRDALSFRGYLYALPFYAESSMTYYRRDLFEKAGVRMPETPSYEDIERLAAAIHDPERGTYGMCLRGKGGWGANMAYFNTLVNTCGGRWFDEQWNTTIDTPEWHKALTLYYDLLTKYGPPDAALNDYNELRTLFTEGHCGIWVDATVFAGTLFNPQMSHVAQNVGFAPAPVDATPKGSHWLWVWTLAIPTSSRFPEAAHTFITWATSRAYIELVAQQKGWVSVPPGTRKSTYHNPEYQAVAPFANFVLETIQSANTTDPTLLPVPYTGIQFLAIPEYPAIGTQVGQKIADVLQGEVSIDRALKELQRQVSEQMQASGYTQ